MSGSGGEIAEAVEGGQEFSLAARITRLYEVMSPAGKAVSDVAVAEGILEKTGVQVSAPYLCLLRTGKRTNPTILHLQGIASYFGVPTSYLIDAEGGTAIESELSLVKALRDNGIRDIATRLSGLTPESVSNLARIVDRVRELEKLPPIEVSDDTGG